MRYASDDEELPGGRALRRLGMKEWEAPLKEVTARALIGPHRLLPIALASSRGQSTRHRRLCMRWAIVEVSQV